MQHVTSWERLAKAEGTEEGFKQGLEFTLEVSQYYFHQKCYRKAESTLQWALEHCERLYGRNCDHVIRILSRMADINMIEQKMVT
jgi:hypothetical protein